MRRPLLPARLALAASVASASWTALDARQAPRLDEGETFYRQGRAAREATVETVVQGDIRVPSSEMPCVNCHRRSGWGTAEGQVTIPPVVGAVLFAPVTRGVAQMGAVRTTGPGTRPAYSDATLLRVLRDGVDPAGRVLSPTMPRYTIDAGTATALAAYLRSLSNHRPAGVTGDTIHLATITTAGVSAARRASLLSVLDTFTRHKNANTRNETGRRERGPWDMARDFQNYRRWVLHEWTLGGPPAGWGAQLDEWYRRQPVFAVVGGVGDESWTPVHQFAERTRLPVILPQVASPPASDSCQSFYSMYFSKGLHLEAALLSEYLQKAAPGATVAQAWRCGGPGEAAARALTARIPSVESLCLNGPAPPSPDDWARLLATHPDHVVLWLAADDLDALGAPWMPGPLQEIAPRLFLSSSLLGGRIETIPATLAARARIIHPSVPPDDLDRHAFRALAWLRANGIEPADRAVAINALFSASLVADALSVPRALESREYFIERIEHMASRSPHRSTYPVVTFGARRRFGSAGGYILAAPSAAGAPFGRVEEWFVPSQ